MSTTEQPAWATDPLPVAVLDSQLDVWAPDDEGEYSCTFDDAYYAPADLEARWGPCVPLRPETPPTSPLPDLSKWHVVPVGATIPAEMPYAYGQYGNGLPIVSAWEEPHVMRLGSTPCYTEHPLTVDPDAPILRAISEATAETAPAVLALIRGDES